MEYPIIKYGNSEKGSIVHFVEKVYNESNEEIYVLTLLDASSMNVKIGDSIGVDALGDGTFSLPIIAQFEFKDLKSVDILIKSLKNLKELKNLVDFADCC